MSGSDGIGRRSKAVDALRSKERRDARAAVSMEVDEDKLALQSTLGFTHDTDVLRVRAVLANERFVPWAGEEGDDVRSWLAWLQEHPRRTLGGWRAELLAKVERELDAGHIFYGRARKHYGAKPSALAPFLRDASLLPKKPPTRKLKDGS